MHAIERAGLRDSEAGRRFGDVNSFAAILGTRFLHGSQLSRRNRRSREDWRVNGYDTDKTTLIHLSTLFSTQPESLVRPEMIQSG